MLEAFHTVGGIVSYGHYEQDNDPENGQEPIEWIVLDVQDGKALLLSKQLLDVMPYNSEIIDITWENCSLRAWLNRDFLNDAFTPEEAELILVTDVDNSKEQGFRGYDTEGGNDTEDRLFLLSYKEAFEQYLHSENERKCLPTDFAYARGAGTTTGTKTNGNKTGWWWLRSPGESQTIPTIVLYVGKKTDYYAVFGRSGCVRPAFWFDLNAL